MKKLMAILTVFALLIGSNMTLSHAQEIESNEEKVYISQKTLTQDEMTELFV